VCRALLERAKEGDVAAAKLTLGYLVGKPEKPVDPDTLDEHEWRREAVPVNKPECRRRGGARGGRQQRA
jgi:hypothetical protein